MARTLELYCPDGRESAHPVIKVILQKLLDRKQEPQLDAGDDKHYLLRSNERGADVHAWFCDEAERQGIRVYPVVLPY